MRDELERYFGRGRTNDPPEEVQVKILYDMGRELERIADALEESKE